MPHVPVGSLMPSSIPEDAKSSSMCLVVTCLSLFAQLPTQFSTTTVSYQLLPAPTQVSFSPKHCLCLQPLKHTKHGRPLSLSL